MQDCKSEEAQMSFFSKLFDRKEVKGNPDAAPERVTSNSSEQHLKLPIQRMKGVVLAFYNYSPDLKSKEEKVQKAMEVFAAMNQDCFNRFMSLSPMPSVGFDVVLATGSDQKEAYMPVIDKGAETFPQCSVFVQYATTPIGGRNVPLILLTYYAPEAGTEKTLIQITQIRPLIPV
jgi:hypothetical protein